jgi:Tfp pilus assembly protein PilW
MLRRIATRAVREEGGFTLVEMLVGAMIGLALIGSSVALFTVGIQSEPKAASRTAQIQEARTFAESLAREVRQGWGVPTATASQLSVITYVKRAACASTAAGPSIPCRVTYSCASGSCDRYVANPDGSGAGPSVRVVDGLASSNVFSYSPTATAPTFIGFRLAFSATGTEDAITVEDGVALRNESPPDAPES